MPNALRITMKHFIEISALGIELCAVAIIIIGILIAAVRYVFFGKAKVGEAYRHFKEQLGKSLLLGLEFLVAADIIRTVALEPNLENVIVLGLLVVVRTFLSWCLVVEIEGRWPWQAEQNGK